MEDPQKLLVAFHCTELRSTIGFLALNLLFLMEFLVHLKTILGDISFITLFTKEIEDILVKLLYVGH